MKEIVCSGALIYALNTCRFLLLHRAQSKNKNLWGLVGGASEQNETPWTALKREIQEEIGQIDIVKSIPLETFVSNDNHFLFHTYLCIVDHEFIPNLNYEHNGYAWVSMGKWPRPLHLGLHNTLKSKINQVKIDTVIKLIKQFTYDGITK
tara:strand:- start:1115 stop:1564 length:450 start_codon:yes stop_codon:yes gene_type:complete